VTPLPVRVAPPFTVRCAIQIIDAGIECDGRARVYGDSAAIDTRLIVSLVFAL